MHFENTAKGEEVNGERGRDGGEWEEEGRGVECAFPQKHTEDFSLSVSMIITLFGDRVFLDVIKLR